MFERCFTGTLLVSAFGLFIACAMPLRAAENDSESPVTTPEPVTDVVAAQTIDPQPAAPESAVESVGDTAPVDVVVAPISVEEKPIPESDFQRVKIADAFIDLRTGPGRGFPIYQSIERGEWVEILRRRTEWFQLRTHRGIVGWASIAAMKETMTEAGEKFFVEEVTEEAFRQRSFEFGFQFGEFESINSFTVFGAWNFTENLATELSYQETLGEVSDGQLVNLSIVNTPFPEWRVSPFFGLGAGIIRTEPFGALVQTEDRQDTTAHVGAGLRTYITRSFVFRMDYKHYMVLTSRNENENVEEWKLGFSVFF